MPEPTLSQSVRFGSFCACHDRAELDRLWLVVEVKTRQHNSLLLLDLALSRCTPVGRTGEREVLRKRLAGKWLRGRRQVDRWQRNHRAH